MGLSDKLKIVLNVKKTPDSAQIGSAASQVWVHASMYVCPYGNYLRTVAGATDFMW